MSPVCAECTKKYDAGHYKNNKNKIAKCRAEHYQNNKEEIAKHKAEYYQNNKKKIEKRKTEYRKNNKEKLALMESKRRKKNKGAINALIVKRRAKKINQTPTGADLKIIQLYYATCSETNEILGDTFFHVDHIQPLSKGGLHHEDNLQILEAPLNLQKNSKWPLTNEEQIRYKGVTL